MAILAVIWGHFLYPVMLQEVYIFHVPLFFVISGFFISKKKDVITFIRDKERQLLLPYILTAVGMLFILLIRLFVQDVSFSEGENTFMERVLALLYGSGSPYECDVFSVNAAGPIWFLLSLFFGLILVRLCIDFKWGFIPIAICILAGYITSQFVWLPFSIQAGMLDAGYIYVGYLIKYFSSLIKDKYTDGMPKRLVVFEYILEIIILVGCVLFIVFYLKKYPSDLILLSCNSFPNGLIDVLASFAGAIAVLLFCKLVLDFIPGIKHGLVYVGKNTLLILCFHSIDTIVFNWDFIINLFPGELGKAIVIIYICKIILYVVLVILWNLLEKVCKKYIMKKDRVGQNERKS